MTVRCVISIFDRVARIYGQPAFVPSLPVARRSFSDEVNRADEGNQLYRHPDDFELHHLGSFDDESGCFVPASDTGPVFVIAAKEVKI